MADRDVLARTWLDQARADLAAAEDSAATGHHEWACFQAQQAGEKALKALLYARGRTSIVTHSLRRLVREGAQADASLSTLDDDARWLDQHYIPTRYPNGLDAETTPAAYLRSEGLRTMSSVCSLDPRARERILGELRRLAAGPRRDFNVESVYVFGSFARGAEHEGSDIDLLVVGDLPGGLFDRVGEVLRRTTLPVEPIVVAPATFERRRRQQHPLFQAIVGEGLRLVQLECGGRVRRRPASAGRRAARSTLIRSLAHVRLYHGHDRHVPCGSSADSVFVCCEPLAKRMIGRRAPSLSCRSASTYADRRGRPAGLRRGALHHHRIPRRGNGRPRLDAARPDASDHQHEEGQ